MVSRPIVVPVVNIIGDRRDRLRLQNEVQELVCLVHMGGIGRDEKGGVVCIGAFFRNREGNVQMQTRCPGTG